MGAKPIPATTRKYKVFRLDVEGHDKALFFVGSHGALRRGRCATESYSVGDPNNQTGFYKRLLEASAKGCFKACLTCLHFRTLQPAAYTVTANDRALKREGYCVEMKQAAAPMNLRCGGDSWKWVEPSQWGQGPLVVGKSADILIIDDPMPKTGHTVQDNAPTTGPSTPVTGWKYWASNLLILNCNEENSQNHADTL